MEEKKIDHEYTDEIVCPYCGHQMTNSWDYDDYGDIDCPKCNKLFEYDRIPIVDCSYSTSKKESE